MANIGGPAQSRRRLIMTIMDSILLYGSEIWADALNVDCRMRILSSVQRTAVFRVASAYRTAILVISGVIPIGLQTSKRKRMWETKKRKRRDSKRLYARKRTIQHWQEKWSTETSGRWTAKLVPDITHWMERKFGKLNTTVICTWLFL